MALLTTWCDCALERLGEAREAIDGLNVYPVADNDTGTNLYLTFEAACQAMEDACPLSLAKALTAFARGALLGARGNSGVILSQLLRAGADALMRGDSVPPGQLLADTLTLAADAAYDAVGQPVEGTLLSVARAAADAAQSAANGPMGPSSSMGTVITAAAEAAREALERTPEQLEILASAGVVDAGGQGLCVLLDAAQEVLSGVRPNRRLVVKSRFRRRARSASVDFQGPSSEVMYLLEARAENVPQLRRRLSELGDSLVVGGGDDLWNVHVHVDDVGAAVEAGIEAGRPYRIHVVSLPSRSDPVHARSREAGRSVVAIPAGTGLQQLFQEAGAHPVRPRRRGRLTSRDLLKAIRSTGTAEVILLPNDVNVLTVAEAAAAAARDANIRATVIPTRSQVQGLAAMAVHQPDRSFDEDVVSMTAAAGHTGSGAVTVAARDAMTMAGPCRAGDSLGMVEGDFAVITDTVDSAALEVVSRLLGGGGEMVTLITGEGCDGDLVRRVTSALAEIRPDVDVVVYEGAQADYPLLIGVE